MAYISGGSYVNDAIMLMLIKKMMLMLMLMIIIMCLRAKPFTWKCVPPTCPFSCKSYQRFCMKTGFEPVRGTM